MRCGLIRGTPSGEVRWRGSTLYPPGSGRLNGETSGETPPVASPFALVGSGARATIPAGRPEPYSRTVSRATREIAPWRSRTK